MSRINPSDFRIKDINITNIDSIQVENASVGRSYGRRFKIKCGSKKSDEVLFRDILKRVHKLARHERNIENLKAIEVCLGKLKQVEEDAVTLYKTQSTAYKIRTGFHRFFNFDHHLNSINFLRSSTQHQLSTLNLTKNLSKIENLPVDSKDNALEKLVTLYLKSNNVGPALEVCGKIKDQKKKDGCLVLLAHDCIDKNDLISAGIATALIGTQSSNLLSLFFEIKHSNPIRDPLLERIAKGFIEKDEPYEAYLTAAKICKTNPKRDFYLEKITREYLAKDDLVTSLKVAGEINDSAVKEVFLETIAENYFQKLDLNEAFETAKKLTISLKKDALLIRIRQKSFDNNDISGALEVNKYITDSQSQNTFTVKIADHYFAKNDLGNALKTTKSLTNKRIKDPLLLKIRQAYFNKKEFTNSLEANKFVLDLNANSAFIVLVAQLYIENSMLLEARSLTKNINLTVDTKDSLLGKIAKNYYSQNDLKNTYETIGSISGNSLKRSKLRLSLADAFFNKGSLSNALKATKLIRNQADKDRMFMKIAEAYFDKGDLVKTLETTKLVSDESLEKNKLIAKIDYQKSWVGYLFG